jgi:endonuclease/exonuclease/phosphatase family metal-dependent hydrolase
MRLATFNVENLFQRVKIMNLGSWSEGRAVLNDFDRLNNIIQKPVYSAADKAKLVEIMEDYPPLFTKGESEFIRLRENRGKLVRTQAGQRVIAATGRGDWIGWFELEKGPVQEAAIQNTARVIKAVNADVLGIVEAEDRIGLLRFNEIVLPQVVGTPYVHVMLIDGNDDRGIDVGLMTKAQFPIGSVRSHVDDPDPQGGRLFSRDCPEFHIPLAGGKTLLVMMNHLKSKGYGIPAESNARRKAQAQRVRDIYEERKQQGFTHVAIMGDMNDTPDSEQLRPLLGNGSDLKDVFVHPSFDNQGRPGTYGNCTASGKLDYILLSPALFNLVNQGTVERHGAWGGTNGTLWPHFPEVQTAVDAASDHVAVWVDLNI